MDKKIIFVLRPHSIIDVITNSSTELFVLDTDKSLDFVKEILESAIQLHNKINKSHLKFKDVFDEPYIQEGDSKIDGWDINIPDKSIVIYSARDNSVPWWICDFLEDNFGYNIRHHLG